MDQRQGSVFFGTPLSDSLPDDSKTNDGPINSRRARLNQQQTVRDEQGRRRFHGAFTGGFSAGYFNSVGSIEGFRPKTFVSHKGQKSKDGETKFSHKPEDYMDEEDMGEFGIAPKKIRVVGGFDNNQPWMNEQHNSSKLLNILKPATQSIGEKILMSMTKQRRARLDDACDEKKFIPKPDFHGLGYEPLKAPISCGSTSSKNPLEALVGQGRRINISGEAFGSGILNEDSDDDELVNTDEYGYEKITDFLSTSHIKQSTSTKTSCPNPGRFGDNQDRYQLDGFVLAHNLNAMELCDNMIEKYPLPTIEPSWKMPMRSEPYVPPVTSQEKEQREMSWRKTLESTRSLTSKFSSNTTTLLSGSETTDIKSGLVTYSDLKAHESRRETSLNNRDDDTCADDSRPNISRHIVEWRPCSLLCKHFNVPNPYPDNSYFGVKSSQLISAQPGHVSTTITIGKDQEDEALRREKLASLGLRQSVFNITFDDDNEVSNEGHRHSRASTPDTYTDEEPQVIETSQANDLVNVQVQQSQSSDDESDILVVSIPKPQPELIVLSSSSASSSSPSSRSSSSSCSPQRSPSAEQARSGLSAKRTAKSRRDREKRGRTDHHDHNDNKNNDDNDLSDDIYGPPLPPTRERLMNVDRRHRSQSSGTSKNLKRNKDKKTRKEKKSKKKKKKKKKEKRHRHGSSKPK